MLPSQIQHGQLGKRSPPFAKVMVDRNSSCFCCCSRESCRVTAAAAAACCSSDCDRNQGFSAKRYGGFFLATSSPESELTGSHGNFTFCDCELNLEASMSSSSLSSLQMESLLSSSSSSPDRENVMCKANAKLAAVATSSVVTSTAERRCCPHVKLEIDRNDILKTTWCLYRWFWFWFIWFVGSLLFLSVLAFLITSYSLLPETRQRTESEGCLWCSCSYRNW